MERSTEAGAGRERGYTAAELWAVARRRARPALAVFAGVLVAGGAVVLSLPDTYRARAVIILEPYRPHAELVLPAVTSLLEDRLRVARQAILSGPVLEKIVVQRELYPEARRKGGLDAAVAKLRAAVEVRPDGESAIEIGYRTDSPGKAAAVVSDLAEGYAAANTRMRTEQARRVHDILASELDHVQKALAAQDAKVSEFRRANDGRLPEQVEANLREAERSSRLLENAETYLRDLQRRRAISAATRANPADVERLAVMESELLRQLNHARALYHEDHPDAVRLERELSGLRRLKDEASSRADGAVREAEAWDQEARRARADISELKAGIARAREAAIGGAQVASQLAVLQRDRDLLAEKYRSLMSRRVESEVTMALEEKAAPAATRTVDPAVDPATPVSPDRARLLLVVLALALMGALATGVLLESRDTTLRTPAQARGELGVPMLAAVPALTDRR